MFLRISILFFFLISTGLSAQTATSPRWSDKKQTKFVRKCVRKYSKKFPEKKVTHSLDKYCSCLQEQLQKEHTFKKAKKMSVEEYMTIAKDCYGHFPIDTTTTK